MTVMKSTNTSQRSKEWSNYTPVRRSSARTTTRKTIVIKRSTPIKSTATTASPPTVTPEAKFATAATAFKSATATFNNILSSISGSFPLEYQQAIKEAINTINAATTAIDATVEAAKFAPASSQLVSVPANEHRDTAASGLPEYAEGIQSGVEHPSLLEIVADETPQVVAHPHEEGNIAPEEMQPSSETAETLHEPLAFQGSKEVPMAEAAEVEGESATIQIDEFSDQETRASKSQAPYNISNYLVFQGLPQTELASDEIRQQLNVIA